MHMSRDALFEKVFKKPPPPRPRDVSVKLYLDDRECDQITILWDPSFTEYRFYSARLASMLDTVLPPQVRTSIHGPDNLFASGTLSKHELRPSLDESEFTLRLSTPARMKRLQKHSLSKQATELGFGEEIQPAHFSAFLNSTWTQNWSYNQRFFSSDSSRTEWIKYNGSPEPQREPLEGELNGAVRTLGWVLLGSGNLTEPDTGDWTAKAFHRTQTQLVHDFLSGNSRLTLMDISPVHDGAGFSSPSLGGLDLQLGNALYVNRRTDGTSARFLLTRPAEVTVYVNGEAVRTLHLGSGEQDIEGITGRAGENNVEIRVTYPDGQTESIPFQFLQASPRVLSFGEQDGSFSAGVQRLGEERYGTSSRDALVSGTYLRGISPFLNGKVGFGANQDLQVANADMLWVEDSASTWDFAATLSRDSAGRFGQKYSLQFYEQIRPVSLMVNASFNQTDFHSSFFAPQTIQPVRFQTGITVDGPVWKGTIDLNASVMFNRRLDSLTSPVDYSAGVSYNIKAWQGLSLRATAGCATSEGKLNPTVGLTLNYFLNSGNQSFYALNQTSNQKQYNAPRLVRNTIKDSMLVGSSMVVTQYDTAQVVPGSYQNSWKNLSTSGWSWSQGTGTVGGKGVSINGSYTPDQYGLQAGAQRTSEYGNLSASYSFTGQNQTGLNSQSHFLSTRLGTALMFADGVFAVGRPVQDGFVLVTGQNDLSWTDFLIDPSEQDNSEYSEGGPVLAASYGLLSPYRTENIKIQPKNPPPGTFLEGDQYFVENTLDQGFLLKIGKPVRIFVRLRLVDESRQGLSYTSFRVYSPMDTGTAIYQSFSNRDGTIQIADLEAGKKYIIRFGEDAFVKDLVIAIPKDAPRIYDMGDIKVDNQSLSQISRLSMAKNAPTEGPAPGIANDPPAASDPKLAPVTTKPY
jgi:outer membrane usher protein